MPNKVPLFTLEEAWRNHPLGRDRGAGGRRSLTGFSYQLALSLDQLLTAALSGTVPGDLLFDSLGDLTHTGDGKAYLIQIKATLTLERARGAAREALAVDAFLAEQFPNLRDTFQFGVWCRRREGSVEPRELQVEDLELTGDDAKRWETIRARILPVEIRPEPFLSIVLRLFPLVEDPFELAEALRGALLHLLGEDAPSDQIVMELLRLISEGRRPAEVFTSGRLLRPEDFLRIKEGSIYILIGDRPRLEDLAEGCFMPRLGRLHRIIDVLTPILDSTDSEVSRRTLPVVWLDGTSGSGKSVLLLQVLEYLVLERDVPVHLLPPSASQRLTEALEFWRRARRQGVIAMDDIYAPEGRQEDVWRNIHALSFDASWAARPVILTCGPPDYRRAFEEEARRGGGLDLIKIPLDVLDAAERNSYSVWYTQRTGHNVKTSGEDNFATAAFLYHLQHEVGAMDLGQFAQRLGDRLRNRGVFDEVLTVIFGTFLGFPLPGRIFAGNEDVCEGLIQERLLRTRLAEDGSQTLTFLHPKLAGRIFDYLVPENELHGRSSYLVRCFSVVQSDPMRSRLFFGLFRSHNLGAKEKGLALEKIWLLLADAELPDLQANLIRSWYDVARSIAPEQASDVLKKVNYWLESSSSLDASRWGVLWQVSWDASLPFPPRALVERGREWLQRNLDLYPWNYIWQKLWKQGEQDEEMTEMAEIWLELNSEHPGWRYVFNLLVDSGYKSAALVKISLLGLVRSPIVVADHELWPKVLALEPNLEEFLQAIVCRLCRCQIYALIKKGVMFVRSVFRSFGELESVAEALENSRDLPSWTIFWWHLVKSFKPVVPLSLQIVGREWLSSHGDQGGWNYVWQCLLGCSSSGGEKEDLRLMGRSWLSGHGDHADWNFVWQRLLRLADSAKEIDDLKAMGCKWLEGREERIEWNYVWQRLVGLSGSTEEMLNLRFVGLNWLLGREERPDWSYVWILLCEIAVSEEDIQSLKSTGLEWLSGRENRAAWSHVWRRLLDTPISVEEMVNLKTVGLYWLSGREDRAEWSYVWQRLLDISGLEVESRGLWSIGREWLSGREDRAEWNYVWRRLIKEAVSAEEIKELKVLGLEWLPGREERADWSHVWQELFAIADPGKEARDFKLLGRDWLVGHKDFVDWPFVWKDLLKTAGRYEIEGIYQLGCEWLEEHEHLAGWSYVWQDLTYCRPLDPILINLARKWLAREQPEVANRIVQKRLAELEAIAKRFRRSPNRT